jgi:hypothetical protein
MNKIDDHAQDDFTECFANGCLSLLHDTDFICEILCSASSIR